MPTVTAWFHSDLVELVGVGADALVLVQRADLGYVTARELEVEDVEVLPDPGRGDRLRENDVAALDVPAQHDLGRGLADPLGDRDDDGVIKHQALPDRGPGLDGDPVLDRKSTRL